MCCVVCTLPRMSLLQAAPVPPEPTGPAHVRIAQARGYHRWSQDTLLDRMRAISPGATPTRRTLSSWEHGHTSPTIPELVVIARATAFPVAWFVMGLEGNSHGPDHGPDQGIASTRCSTLRLVA